MKALVMEKYRTFAYREVPKPEIAADEVLVQVKACAICGSDIHGCTGGSGRRLPPLIMGHEASGVIDRVGAAVTDWQSGQRVTFDSTEYCGKCWYCRNGYHNLCANRRILGVACEDYRKDGAMAQYIAVKAHTLYAIPDNVCFEDACLVEPLAVGMHAVRLSGLAAGQVAAVIGAGTIGLMTLLAANTAAPGGIYVSGRHAYRLEAAMRFGACAAVSDDNRELRSLLDPVTDGRGADVVFDTVGTQASFDCAFGAVRKGGKIVCIGNASQEITLPLQACIVNQINIINSYSSEGEYPACLDAIARGTIDLRGLRSSVPLSDGQSAFDRLLAKEEGLLKIVLLP